MLGLAAVTLLALSARAGSISFDPSLVQPLDAVDDQLRGSRPYLAHFRRDGRDLYYVSAGGEPPFDASTRALVVRVRARYPVDAAIVEGRDAIDEPTEAALLRADVAAGFSEADWLGERFLAAIPVRRRAGGLEADGLPRLFSETTSRARRVAGVSVSLRFSYDDFLLWYERRMGAKFDPEKIEAEMTAPEEHGRLCVQRLANVEDLARGRFLLARLADELDRHRRVLVVYGGGRLATQERALEAALGRPVYEGDLSGRGGGG